MNRRGSGDGNCDHYAGSGRGSANEAHGACGGCANKVIYLLSGQAYIIYSASHVALGIAANKHTNYVGCRMIFDKWHCLH